MNILIKLMSIVSLVIAPTLAGMNGVDKSSSEKPVQTESVAPAQETTVAPVAADTTTIQ